MDGKLVEGTWRAHQVPLSETRDNAAHRAQLEQWLRSYRPEELFDGEGRLIPELRALSPHGTKRMSATPHANGGELLRDLRLPEFTDYAVDVPEPGTGPVGTVAVLGTWLRDVIRMNPDNFRMMAPDETASNRLQAVFEATDRQFLGDLVSTDEGVSQVGRVTEVLSEHLCQGWLEGYLLTGRHGFFNCYEAFIHLVDSMFNQHAKWLDACRHIPWRRPIASLTYLLTSHVWRQDHNGFSHQDPGFLDHVLNKKPQIVRAYLPPDANTLLSTMAHCLRTRNYVNVVVAGKQPGPQWLTMDEAIAHCTRGLGIWDWASNCGDEEPDVVLGCAGDVPTIEALAAVSLLRRHLPQVKVRLVNVVDIMRLQDEREHPHGLSNREFDGIFTRDKPVIFAYHGYPWLIHRLTYRRTNHPNIHVRGYKEEGTTTTPFDMVMLNDLDRFHLVIDVIDRVPGLAVRARRPAPAHGGRAPALPAAHPPVRGGRPGRGRLGLARISGSRIPGVCPHPGVPPVPPDRGIPGSDSRWAFLRWFHWLHQPKHRRKVRRVLRRVAPATPDHSPHHHVCRRAADVPLARPGRRRPGRLSRGVARRRRPVRRRAARDRPRLRPGCRHRRRRGPGDLALGLHAPGRAPRAGGAVRLAAQHPAPGVPQGREPGEPGDPGRRAAPRRPRRRPATSRCAAPPRGRPRTRRSAAPTSQRSARRCAGGSPCGSRG